MSVKNFKIPLKGFDAVLSFAELEHENSAGQKYKTHEIALMGTNDHKEFVFIGEPIQIYDLTDVYDVLYTVIHDEDWSYFMNQYDIELELEPQLELVIDNDTETK